MTDYWIVNGQPVLFSKVFKNRLTNTPDENQLQKWILNNKPFMNRKSTAWKTAEYNKPLYLICVGHEKVFDSVKNSAVFKSLQVQDIEIIYNNSTGIFWWKKDTLIIYSITLKYFIEAEQRIFDSSAICWQYLIIPEMKNDLNRKVSNYI